MELEFLVTGQKLRINDFENDYHGIPEGTIVEFVREHSYPVFGYMVRYKGELIKIKEEHFEII